VRPLCTSLHNLLHHLTIMKVSETLALFALATQTISGTSIPDPSPKDVTLAYSVSHRAVLASSLISSEYSLERRKGGGGASSVGSSGGRSSSGGSSSSSGSRSSSGATSGSSRTSGTSAMGGSTRSGSGLTRSFGGGRYYSGGAAVPYKAGKRTPQGLIAGALITPLVLLSIMPGLWLYNAYPYYYNNPYRFYNQSAQNDGDNNSNKNRRGLRGRQSMGQNQTLPVMCLCQEFTSCGCDENGDQQYLNDLIGNGSYAALNKTLVTVSDVNGTRTLVLNGSLPNGTTAPGGTDGQEGLANSLGMGKYTGYWALFLVVVYAVVLF